MNKIIIFAALAAALTLSSCRKEESKNYDPGTLRTVHFTTSPYITKTVFGEKNSDNKYPVLWQDGDKVCPSLNFAKPESENYIEVTPTPDNYEIAEFSGKFPTAASYRFFFVSPAAAFKSANETNNTIMVEFPAGQTSTEESPDPAAQILFADTGVITEIPDPVNLEFYHLSAYLHIKITGINTETYEVQAVNITNEDRFLAGRIFYNLENHSFEASTEFNTISVATTTLTDVWCSVCPVDLSGGQLTIEVSTDKGTFTKTVNMPASADLTRGKVAKFTVNMAGVEPVTPVVYKAVTNTNQLNVGDKVIIAAADIDQAYAMSTGQNTNNRSAAGVSKTADEIVNPTDAVEIFELEDGIIPGHFAFKATGTPAPGYIYAANSASSGSNILKTKKTLDNSASWEIKIGDVTAGGKTWEEASIIFADIPSTGRGLIRFNSNDKLFTAYGNGSAQQAVKLYRLYKDASPHFNVTLPEGDIVYSSGAVEIPIYVFGNVDWTANVTGSAVFTDTSEASISGNGNTVLSLSLPELDSAVESESFTLTIFTTETVTESEFTFTIKQIKPIEVNNILFHELYWKGSVAGKNLLDYQESGNATTSVYGGVEIVYSQDSNSKFFDWPENGNVFLPVPYDGSLPHTGMDINLRIQKNGGWIKAAGVPCKGVKNATLTYKLNRNGVEYTASSDTDGVTVGDLTRTSGTSDWGKDYTEYSYPLTFSDGLTFFNFKITDSHASNHIYIADIKIVVTAVY